jgi:hypothetical protein
MRNAAQHSRGGGDSFARAVPKDAARVFGADVKMGDARVSAADVFCQSGLTLNFSAGR